MPAALARTCALNADALAVERWRIVRPIIGKFVFTFDFFYTHS